MLWSETKIRSILEFRITLSQMIGKIILRASDEAKEVTNPSTHSSVDLSSR